MKQKWILPGTALMLAAALTGCGSNAPTSSQPQRRQHRGGQLPQGLEQTVDQRARQDAMAAVRGGVTT